MTYTGLSTKFQEPPLSKAPQGTVEGRWTWWFSAIADAMIRHPDKKIKDIAVLLNKSPNYLSMIINTDLFREYLAQRKEAWRQDHDHALRAKLTDVATESLDIVLEQLKAKRSQIPLNAALRVTESALDRLGYSPNAPSVVVDNSVHDNRQQTVAVSGLSASDLEDARAALRRVEQARSGTSLAPPSSLEVALEQGAGHNVSDVIDASVEEVSLDPST